MGLLERRHREFAGTISFTSVLSEPEVVVPVCASLISEAVEVPQHLRSDQ